MSVESELSAYNAGARGGAPIGVAAEDMAAWQAGAQSHGGGGGGGGGLLLIPLCWRCPSPSSSVCACTRCQGC